MFPGTRDPDTAWDLFPSPHAEAEPRRRITRRLLRRTGNWLGANVETLNLSHTRAPDTKMKDRLEIETQTGTMTDGLLPLAKGQRNGCTEKTL